MLHDNQHLAQLELELYLEQQADTIAPELEIDSVPDDFGALYRVWCGIRLIGTFYRDLEGLFVSQPINSTKRQRWTTSEEAVNAILAVQNLAHLA